MRCDRAFKKIARNQQGFSLILVLFLLVVVSLLAISMARLNTGGQKAIGQEILSARALMAAESGLQAAGMKIFPIPATTPACPSPAVSITFPSTAIGLNGCSVSVTCTPPTTIAGRTLLTLVSTGVCGAGNETAQRKVTMGLRAL